MANIRTTVQDTLNNDAITCSQFAIEDTEIPFVCDKVCASAGDYVFSAYIKAPSDNATMVVAERTEITIPTANEWKFVKAVFNKTSKDSNAFVLKFGNTGNYRIYHAQVERGNTATKWQPAPDDLNTFIKETTDGIEVGKFDSNGVASGMSALLSAEGSFDIRQNGTKIATFDNDEVSFKENGKPYASFQALHNIPLIDPNTHEESMADMTSVSANKNAAHDDLQYMFSDTIHAINIMTSKDITAPNANRAITSRIKLFALDDPAKPNDPYGIIHFAVAPPKTNRPWGFVFSGGPVLVPELHVDNLAWGDGIRNATYPIGSVYETFDEETNPAAVFGGTWELVRPKRYSMEYPRIFTAGFLTGANTSVAVTIPTPPGVVDTDKLGPGYFGIILRQNNAYISGTTALSDCYCDGIVAGDSFLSMYIHKSNNGSFGGTNNAPVGVEFVNLKLDILNATAKWERIE